LKTVTKGSWAAPEDPLLGKKKGVSDTQKRSLPGGRRAQKNACSRLKRAPRGGKLFLEISVRRGVSKGVVIPGGSAEPEKGNWEKKSPWRTKGGKRASGGVTQTSKTVFLLLREKIKNPNRKESWFIGSKNVGGRKRP